MSAARGRVQSADSTVFNGYGLYVLAVPGIKDVRGKCPPKLGGSRGQSCNYVTVRRDGLSGQAELGPGGGQRIVDVAEDVLLADVVEEVGAAERHHRLGVDVGE